MAKPFVLLACGQCLYVGDRVLLVHAASPGLDPTEYHVDEIAPSQARFRDGPIWKDGKNYRLVERLR